MSQRTAIQPLAAQGQLASDTYRYIEVSPINGAIGAEISGVNLGDTLSGSVVEELTEALNHHQVIVFRDQQLCPTELANIGRRFGPLHINPFVPGLKEAPEVMAVRSAENAEKQFTGLWHSDISWDVEPSMGSLLYAVELPTAGGDTLFSNMYLAFSTLSLGLQALLRGLRAEHRVDRHHRSRPDHGSVPEDGVMHPVVTVHPDTRQEILFVNEYFTTRFEDMTEEESRPLLDFLFEHLVRPDFTCRIRWEPGTLVFWDNRCTQHYATNDYAGQAREMHRVTIKGSVPEPAQTR